MNIKSYPPLFRPHSNLTQNIDPDAPIEHIEDLDPVPVIDLQCLEKLDKACENWGLFRLVNHGVPSTLLSQIQDQARKLFSLPFEHKQAIISSPLSYVWGTVFLSSSGAAVRSSQDMFNCWAEVINFPVTQLLQLRTQDSLLDSFRHLVEEYGKHLARIARTIFQVMAKNLNLDPRQSESYLAESTAFIRAHRYPQISKGKQAWGAGPHRDGSLFSILSQDQIGGLEVYKDNKWFPVKPVVNTLLINLGDMMKAISDERYVSAKHRVRVYKQEDRISVNYFVFPDFDCVIRSSKYKPFTYNEFRAQGQKDIESLGFIVGLEGFKLSR